MKPKKLNLSEMWKVYQLLYPAVSTIEMDDSVIDNVLDIIELSTPEALLEVMGIMYDNKARFNNPMEFNELFIKGLSENEFFVFHAHMGVISGRSK